MIVWMSAGIWVSYVSPLQEIIQGPRFPHSHCYIPYDIVLVCMLETGLPSFAWTSSHEVGSGGNRRTEISFSESDAQIALIICVHFPLMNTQSHGHIKVKKVWKRGFLSGRHVILEISFSAIVEKVVRALRSSRVASLDTML